MGKLTKADAERLSKLISRASNLNYVEGVEEAGEGDGPGLDRARKRATAATARWRELLAELTEGEPEVGDPDLTPSFYPEDECQEEIPIDPKYICTLRKGHEGPHVAGTGREVVAVWPNWKEQS